MGESLVVTKNYAEILLHFGSCGAACQLGAARWLQHRQPLAGSCWEKCMATFVCDSAQAAVSRHVQLLPASKHVFTEGSPCVLPCVHAMKEAAETSCAGHVVPGRLMLAPLVLEAAAPLSCLRLPA